MIGMHGKREPVAPIGPVLQTPQVDVIPAHTDARRAFAQLPHEVERQSFLDVDPDVLILRLAHK